MTESLRMQGQGKYLSESYERLIRPPAPIDADAEDVIADVVERAGLVMV